MRHVALLLAGIALLAACGSAGEQTAVAPVTPASASTAATTGGSEEFGGEVLVFAAASLTDAFGAIATGFEEAHPGTSVTLNLAGSQQLAGQILAGAPADVFASANAAQMARITEEGLTSAQPVTFAENSLAIAVEPGNPKDVAGLGDLARDDLVVVLAAEEVPAGAFARQALDAAGVGVRPASLETDVRAALSKVQLGEADAGIVYASDVVAAGDGVTRVEIPAAENVLASYPVAPLEAASNPEGAAAFVDFLRSPTARETLTGLGFRSP